ncbi:MAG: TolC family protein [Chitinispirillaceae bacterium]|nr:TolC family protein [Chitinispirillaceae bacterium]
MPSNNHAFATKAFFLCVIAVGAANGADSLTLDSFVKLALENNPRTKLSVAQVRSSEASYAVARSALLPHVGLRAGVTRNQSLDSIGPPGDPADRLSLGVSASQQVFDFGKTGAKTRQAGFNLAATKESERAALHEIVLAAKTAYFNCLLARKVLHVARESLKQSQQHLDDARTQFEIGKQAKYAVVKAEVDVANTQVSLIKAENGIKAAKIKMETASGVPLPENVRLLDVLEAQEPLLSLDEALARADSLHPDLREAAAKREAARSQVRSARASYWPSIDASAGYSYQKTVPQEWRGGWNAGLSLTQPLYQGGFIRAGVLQAEASLAQAEAALDQARQNVRAEVSQTIIDKQDAEERIAAALKYIGQAELGLSMSQERFKAGSATFIEVTDAEVALVNARIAHAQALFDYRVAHAKLLAAIGARYSFDRQNGDSQ